MYVRNKKHTKGFTGDVERAKNKKSFLFFRAEEPAKTRSGFTLIELMVSVTVFSIVMLVATSTLLAIVDANRKAQALKSVMNNLNFALENMSRTVRVGTNYHCKPYQPFDDPPAVPSNITDTNDCPTDGGVLLALEGSNGDITDPTDQIIYRLNGTHLERSLDAGSTFTAITAPEVEIQYFRFYTIGSAPLTDGDSVQPRVVMVIDGVAGTADETRTEFSIQASVSQRLIDI